MSELGRSSAKAAGLTPRERFSAGIAEMTRIAGAANPIAREKYTRRTLQILSERGRDPRVIRALENER